jgi:hypothetical protein
MGEDFSDPDHIVKMMGEISKTDIRNRFPEISVPGP